MIDLDKIRRQPTAWVVFREVLGNWLALVLFIYGFACLITSQALVPGRARHLRQVTGAAAALGGLGYLCFGVFVYFSDGPPPPENRPPVWRILRAVIRWGGLGAGAILIFDASFPGELTMPFDPEPRVWRPIIETMGLVAGLAVLLCYLSAMFQREAVKRDLLGSGFEPLHIWWRPAAYWLPWGYRWATGFRVIYSDPAGVTHKGYCLVYRSLLKDPQWGTREVRWLAVTAV